jgi:tight adherence protein B
MLLPVVLTFALVIGVIVGVYWLFVAKPESAEQSALRKRMKPLPAGVRRTGGGAAAGGLVRDEAPLSGIALLDRVLRGSDRITEPSRRLIQRAGLSLTVGTLLLLCAVAGLAAYALVLWVTRLPYLALLAGALSLFLPIGVIRFMAKRRVGQFEEQFPEAIDLLSRALKAGHAFTTGLSMVADEMADPVGSEFRLAFDRQNFGMPLPDALRSLGERVPLLDARFFVTAVLTQREAGGNLSEVLDNLAAVIRERFRVKRQVRVVTAHARMTGWVLVALPVALALVLTLLSPQHMSVLWTDPTGIRMVTVAVILQVVGSLIIRKLVDVEY